MLRSLLLVGSLAVLQPLSACSCFGPQTFCQTLDPPYTDWDPAWWIPSDIIMAVKVVGVEYGADMKVVQTFSGTLHPEEMIRVWGDCGLLCRHYVDGVADGDTVIWALRPCDLSGNGSCGTSFEQEGDYQLSVCGIYWLGYDNGIVSGPLTVEGAEESMTLGEFAALVDGCLSTTVQEVQEADPLVVRSGDDGAWLSLSAPGRVMLTVMDACGRLELSRQWDGSPIQLKDVAPGAYVVQVRRDERTWTRKVLIHR
jgi:hypothetical protein